MKRLCMLVIGWTLCIAETHSQEEAALQHFIDECIAAGGGDVVVPPGVHDIEKGLVIRNAKRIRLTGMDKESTVLRLRAPAATRIAEPTVAHAMAVPVISVTGLKAGMKISLARSQPSAATGHWQPTERIYEILYVAPPRVVLSTPLDRALPLDSTLEEVRPSVILQIEGTCGDVSISKLSFQVSAPAAHTYGMLGNTRGISTHSRDRRELPHQSLKVEDCIFNGFADGAMVLDANKLTVSNNAIMDCGEAGLVIGETVKQVEIGGNWFSRTKHAFILQRYDTAQPLIASLKGQVEDQNEYYESGSPLTLKYQQGLRSE